jgi:hypothetical protein
MSRKMISVEESFAARRERMQTTQAVIAGLDLESGWVKPSTRTLERLAAATGMRLRISLQAGVIANLLPRPV